MSAGLFFFTQSRRRAHKRNLALTCQLSGEPQQQLTYRFAENTHRCEVRSAEALIKIG